MVYEWHKICREAKMAMRGQLVGYCGSLDREKGDLPLEKGSGDGAMLMSLGKSADSWIWAGRFN